MHGHLNVRLYSKLSLIEDLVREVCSHIFVQ